MSNLTILHVTAPARFGGLERVVHGLSLGHVVAGHRVHVAAVLPSTDPAHPFLKTLVDGGVDVDVVGLRHSRAYLDERQRVAVLCRSLRPDVVHTHGYRPDVVDAGVARRFGIPTATTVHGFTGGDAKNRLYEWLQRRSFRRFDAVVAVSRPLAEQLRCSGVPADRLHVFPNAWTGNAPMLGKIEARAELGVPPDAFHIGWVGRLTREKGMDVVVDALAELLDLSPMVSVLGEGPERPALKARAVTRGVNSLVRWHGFVMEAARLFPSFDVFVLSSRTEGTPIVLFEAMEAGVPIIATRVGGVPDVVSEAEALLVPPNEPKALATAVRATQDDPAAALTRAAAAKARLRDQFSAGPWLASYENLYYSLRRRHTGQTAR